MCTTRLGLTSGARYLFNWNGELVEDLSQVPSLPKILQPTSGIVLGPIWVTKGEMFSAKGPLDFMSLMVANTRERLSLSKGLMEDCAEILHDECCRGFVNQEVEKQLKEEVEVVEELERVLQMLLQILATIKTLHAEESEVSPSAHKFQHISEISSDNRLINGLQCFRIFIYPNGQKCEEKLVVNIRELLKGTKTKAEEMQRFFDFVNSNSNVIKMFEMDIRMVSVKRAFLIGGEEITSLSMLSQDAKIWLTLGEDFIPIQYSILSISPEKVIFKNLWGMNKILQKEDWTGNSFTKPKFWQVLPSIPDQCQIEDVELSSFDEKLAFLKKSYETRIREKNTFLQFKKDSSLVLYPQLKLLVKGLNHEINMWGEKIDQWFITKDGHICNRSFSNLLLGISDNSICFLLNDKEDSEMLDGAAVMLFEKSSNMHMKWTFTKDGYIQSLENPGYVLTAVNGFELEQNSCDSDQSNPVISWEINNYNQNIVVMEKNNLQKSNLNNSIDELPDHYDGDDKIEMNKTIFISKRYDGEKITLVVLPRFPVHHFLASKQRWAIKNEQTQELGKLSKKWERQNLCWPVNESEEYIADVLEGFLVYDVPQLRWKSFEKKNDLFRVATRTVKPIKIQLLRNGEEKSQAVSVFCPEARIGKSNQSFQKGNGFSGILNIGFTKFLERCTEVLNLPSAARRLFSSEGIEIFSLSNLNEDDLVYVSCGEVWIKPSHEEEMTLASLISDVNKVRQFSLFRQQNGLIVSAPNDMSKYTSLHLIEEPSVKPDENKIEFQNKVEDEKQYNVCLYKWVYADEFIHLKENPNYVINIYNNQTTANEDLVICKRQIDIPTQRWTLEMDGSIHSKANPQLVMAVCMPVVKNDNYKNVFKDARLIVTNKKILVNGNSNQLFKIDEISGFMKAFAADQVNIEVTASNKTGVCTFAVFGENKIIQPGFVWKKQKRDGSIKKILLCESCGIVVRGSKKLEAINGFVEFSCAIGNAKKNKIKIKGSFLCLNNRIDLSPPQLESTLFLCEKLLELRQDAGTCKTVNKVIPSNPAVRILAHKNGCNDDGVLVIGNSIQQLLDQCTSKLNLSQSARLLFLMNGELVTNMNQILKPYYPELTYIKQGFLQILNEENNDIERLDVRIPVDVWVSVGESYIPLQDPEKSERFISTSKQLAKLQMINDLQVKKHKLRHSKARRLLELSSETSIKPVIIKSIEEPPKEIDQSISQLQKHLNDVKLQERNITSDLLKKSNKNLYTMPQALKLFVFLNGEDPNITSVVFARTFQELLSIATTKLNLPSCARRVFSKEGDEIFSMDSLVRNQTICISCGNRFLNQDEKKNLIDLKAKWSRSQKKMFLEETENERGIAENESVKRIKSKKNVKKVLKDYGDDEDCTNKGDDEENQDNEEDETILMTSEDFSTNIDDSESIANEATKNQSKLPSSIRFGLSLRVY
ncbi:doublecortin domain-containing protein 1 isoform X2 [Hydra vulgaris]|nr:doublecortin domain-containing protein 1 isoform X2 [Hydra vulgaris]